MMGLERRRKGRGIVVGLGDVGGWVGGNLRVEFSR